MVDHKNIESALVEVIKVVYSQGTKNHLFNITHNTPTLAETPTDYISFESLIDLFLAVTSTILLVYV